jgi:hypothetical protein
MRKVFMILLAALFVGSLALVEYGCSANTEGGAILLPPSLQGDTGAESGVDVDGDGQQCPDCECNCGDDCCDGGDVICDCDAQATAECNCDCCDGEPEPEPEPVCGDGILNQQVEECEVGIPCEGSCLECNEDTCLCQPIEIADKDCDCVPDEEDNCEEIYNPDQAEGWDPENPQLGFNPCLAAEDDTFICELEECEFEDFNSFCGEGLSFVFDTLMVPMCHRESEIDEGTTLCVPIWCICGEEFEVPNLPSEPPDPLCACDPHLDHEFDTLGSCEGDVQLPIDLACVEPK